MVIKAITPDIKDLPTSTRSDGYTIYINGVKQEGRYSRITTVGDNVYLLRIDK